MIFYKMNGTITHSPSIAPALKAFMSKALPANQGGHVLALGESHRQTANKAFLSEHLSELADPSQHNVGLIALEQQLCMNVLLWAYKDGKLKPPSDVQPANYLHDMFRFVTESDYSEGSKAISDLAIKSINEGDSVHFQCFDTRYSLSDLLKNFADQFDSTKLASIKYPDDAADHYTRTSFVLREIQRLLKENPEYQLRLDNLEAVISAQRKWNEHHPNKTIGCDALSAAVMKAMLPEDADGTPQNAITISGLDHITGLSDSVTKLDGTFAQHLARSQFSSAFLWGLQTTTALVGSSSEIRRALTKLDFFPDLARQWHPFHFPDMLDVETGEVIKDDVREAAPDSVAATLIRERNAYRAKHRYLKDDTYPTQINLKELLISTRGIRQCKPLQDALARVHKDYQSMYAAEREQRKSPQR